MVVADTMDGGLGAVARAQEEWFSARGWAVTLADPSIPPSIRHVGAAARAARRLRRLVGDVRPDVVHVHGMRSAAITLAAGVRRPFVTVHGMTPVASDPYGFHRLRLVGRAILPRIATVSSAEPGYRGRWRTVVFASPHLASVADLPFPPASSRPTFVWLGALDERKRPEAFVRAVADVASTGVAVRGVIAGDGPRRDEIAGLVHSLGAPVELVGHVAPATVLRDAWATALLSDGEGVPLAVEEAMWANRSVVASRLPGTSLLLGTTGTLVDDPAEAAVALSALCDHRIAKAAGEQAGRRVRAVVDPDEPWRTFEQLYRT